METLAHAGVIFADDFNRPNSLIVGNGWLEDDSVPASSVISDGELSLDGFDPAIERHFSATGFSNLVLTVDWKRSGGILPDFLFVFWGDGAGTDLLVQTLTAPTAFQTLTAELPSSADNLADLVITFALNSDELADSFRFDDFSLEGSNSVPEPGTLALLTAGLMGLPLLRRARKAFSAHQASANFATAIRSFREPGTGRWRSAASIVSKN